MVANQSEQLRDIPIGFASSSPDINQPLTTAAEVSMAADDVNLRRDKYRAWKVACRAGGGSANIAECCGKQSRASRNVRPL